MPANGAHRFWQHLHRTVPSGTLSALAVRPTAALGSYIISTGRDAKSDLHRAAMRAPAAKLDKTRKFAGQAWQGPVWQFLQLDRPHLRDSVARPGDRAKPGNHSRYGPFGTGIQATAVSPLSQ